MSSISKDLIQTMKVVLLATIIALSAQLVFAAWDPPPASPPNNNAEAPLNVSNNAQIKGGGLTVNNDNQATYGLQVPHGQSLFGVPQNGVGILDVLNVFGNIGADEYCDRNFTNCTPASELGGSDGGPSGPSGASDLGYEIVQAPFVVDNFATVGCPAGKVLIGGGCNAPNSGPNYDHDGFFRSAPIPGGPGGSFIWSCAQQRSRNLQATAICINE